MNFFFNVLKSVFHEKNCFVLKFQFRRKHSPKTPLLNKSKTPPWGANTPVQETIWIQSLQIQTCAFWWFWICFKKTHPIGDMILQEVLVSNIMGVPFLQSTWGQRIETFKQSTRRGCHIDHWFLQFPLLKTRFYFEEVGFLKNTLKNPVLLSKKWVLNLKCMYCLFSPSTRYISLITF